MNIFILLIYITAGITFIFFIINQIRLSKNIKEQEKLLQERYKK